MKSILMTIAAVAIAIAAHAQNTVKDGIKMYNYKKYQSAEKILMPLAAADPLANYYLGLAYLGEGNITRADETFRKYPEDYANMSGTARVAFANKDAAKGMQIAKDLAGKAKKKDWAPTRYAADAITYSDGGDPQQAKVWYTDVLTKNDDADVRISLGDANRKLPGSVGGGEAMSSYERVTEKDPKNSLAFTRIGDLWYDARNYQSALDNYARAKDADNTNPLPYRALADAYTRSGKYQLALENIKKYIELSDNTNADKLTYLRILYLAQSYCDAAKYATDLNSNSGLTKEHKVELTGILGYSQANCGDSLQALQTLRTYFRIQDEKKILSGDYIQLGKLYLKLGMIDSAGILYTRGIKDDTAKNRADIYRDIAEAFKGTKDYCKSAEWYNNIIQINPDAQPGDYAWRSIMYYYCRNYSKAMEVSATFVSKYPDQPSAIFWQAKAAAAIDSDATTGGAENYYTQWLEKVGPDYKNKTDMKNAYQYLLFYYYNKKDKEKINEYIEKIRAIDPKDKTMLEIEAAEKAGSAPKKAGGK